MATDNEYAVHVAEFDGLLKLIPLLEANSARTLTPEVYLVGSTLVEAHIENEIDVFCAITTGITYDKSKAVVKLSGASERFDIMGESRDGAFWLTELWQYAQPAPAVIAVDQIASEIGDNFAEMVDSYDIGYAVDKQRFASPAAKQLVTKLSNFIWKVLASS